MIKQLNNLVASILNLILPLLIKSTIIWLVFPPIATLFGLPGMSFVTAMALILFCNQCIWWKNTLPVELMNG